jgi:subtilisin family serine protease
MCQIISKVVSYTQNYKLMRRAESSWADRWFQDLQKVQQAVEKTRSGDLAPVKVAILDTGVNFHHCQIKTAIEMGVIDAKRCKGFPECSRYDPKADNNGHGTQVASVLLQTSPYIALYVARVVDDAGEMASDHDYQEIANVRIYTFKDFANCTGNRLGCR